MLAGAGILVVFMLAILRFSDERRAREQVELRARRLDLVGQIRTGLASASAAETSAVLATTDEASRAFADRARALNADVERAGQELAALLETGGTPKERDALARFLETFGELRRIDEDILTLAVKSTNLKASALTYGPAADALAEMGAALTRLEEGGGELSPPAPPERVQVQRLASRAHIASLRLLTMLPPHIAEQSDDEMTAMEVRMTEQEQTVRASLDALAALPSAAGGPELAHATSAWERFLPLRSQILALSRENTNVRSLDLSLNRKRGALGVSQEALATLQHAIETEGERTPSGRWVLPR
jgi:hypothetical protein